MKKIIAFILLSALVLSLGTTAASAKAAPQAQPRGICFVDANHDGVCDNCPNGGVRLQNGTGCRADCNKNGSASFTDANGDGVCDNRHGASVCPQYGKSMQGCGQSCGKGRNK